MTAPRLADGDAITCPHCGESHPVEQTRRWLHGARLLVYRCGEHTYRADPRDRVIVSTQADT